MNKILRIFTKNKKPYLQNEVKKALEQFEKEHCEKCNNDMGWKCQSCYCSTIRFVLERWLVK